jgi:hypothetical protein
MALRSKPLWALIATSLVALPLEAQRMAIPAAAFTDSAALDAAIPRCGGRGQGRDGGAAVSISLRGGRGAPTGTTPAGNTHHHGKAHALTETSKAPHT